MKNIIKNLRTLSLATFFIVPLTSLCMITQGPKTGVQLPTGPMPQLTKDDMDSMMKMLEGMDEETLNSLAQIGEEFIKEAEAQGKDPFELLGFPPEEGQKLPELVPQPTAPILEPTISEIVHPTQELPKVELHTLNELKAILTSLAEVIASIRQKAALDGSFSDKLKPLSYVLDDITYFIYLLKQDKLIKYVLDKEFEKLYKTLKTLNDELSYLEPLFIVKEPSIGEVSPYTTLGISRDASWADINDAYQKALREKNPATLKKQLTQEGKSGQELKNAMQNAQTEYDAIGEAYSTILANLQTNQALDRIITAISQAVYTNNMIEETKKLLKRYEPEAFKLKEEQEKKEARSRKDQEEAAKKIPAFSMPVFEPWGGGYNRGAGEHQRDGGYLTTTPTQPYYGGSEAGKQQRGGAPDAGVPSTRDTKAGKGTETDKKKEAEDKKKKEEEEKKKKEEKKPENKDVKNRLKELAKLRDDLVEYIDLGPRVGEAPAKKVLENLNSFVTKPTDVSTSALADPKVMSALEKGLQKAKTINDTFTELATKFRKAERMLKMSGLSKEERTDFKTKAQKIFKDAKDYQDSIAALNIGALSTMKGPSSTIPTKVPVFSYIILGTALDFDDPAMASLKKLLNDEVDRDKASVIRPPSRPLSDFIYAFNRFREELNKK